MSFLVIFGAIVVSLFLIFGAASLFVFIQYITFFRFRSCKHCKHTMEYKGLKEDDADGHYLFHCPECGAWEQVPRSEFFQQ